jgi:hypothetical protein
MRVGSMWRATFFTAFALATLIAWTGVTWAQQRAQSVNGLFGDRTLGGGIGRSGSSAFNQVGGEGGDRIQQMQTGAGELQGSERFIRGNRQPGQFVGADTGDVSSTIFGSMAGSEAGAAGGLGGLQNLIGRAAQDRGALGGPTGRFGGRQSQVTPSLGMVVGFDPPRPAATTVSSQIERRLEKMTQIRRFGPLTVTLEARTATIRGAVATEHERALVGHLVMLEPGVSQVRNEVVVGQPPVDQRVEPQDSPSDRSSPDGAARLELSEPVPARPED